jgi:hypothetical protein
MRIGIRIHPYLRVSAMTHSVRVTSGIMAPRCVREAELTVFSYVLARHREFVIHGLETCYLNAVSHSVDPQNLKMSLYHPEI